MTQKKKTSGTARSELNWSEVDRALKLMAKHGLDEFEYSDGDLHVRLKKASASVAAAPGEKAAAAAPAAETGGENLHVVKSPIVGTFYAAVNPGAPPFARVGDQVSAGQVLCIIEAMKLMNEIESDVAGEIARIFVENGQPVEYGEPLFAIRPAAPGRPV